MNEKVTCGIRITCHVVLEGKTLGTLVEAKCQV